MPPESPSEPGPFEGFPTATDPNGREQIKVDQRMCKMLAGLGRGVAHNSIRRGMVQRPLQVSIADMIRPRLLST